ncbi:endonuclease III domain-containing protein [Deinococcus radiophilus]|uniref:endonuclease III domain-containing protein n=1 Tax=Deinococcus radiophilus TaxID=32062 RepID=UPI00360B0646
MNRARENRVSPATLPPPEWWPEAAQALLLAQGYAELPEEPTPNPEPLDGLIRLILAQQNTWAVAQRQWEALRAAYPRWELALVAEPETLKRCCGLLGADWPGPNRAPSGAYCTNWPSGEASLRWLQRLDDAQARAELEALPGVGRRSASLLLLFHLARPAAAVDGNIERVLWRLEVVPPTWPAAKQEQWLEGVLPLDTAYRAAFHRAGVRHGREVCTRRSPDCPSCVLNRWCPSAELFMAAGPPAVETD